MLDEFGGGFDAEVVHHFVLMGFDGTGGDIENATDFLGGFAFGDQLEDFALAGGEFEGVAEVDAGFVEHFVDGRGTEARGDVGLAGEGMADGGDEFFRGGVFEDIGEGTGFEGAEEVGGVRVHGEEDEFRFGKLAGGFDAVEHGHGDVGDDDIGPEGEGFLDELAAVGGGADDVELRGEEDIEAVEDDFMIVGKEDTGFYGLHLAWIVVPRPGCVVRVN